MAGGPVVTLLSDFGTTDSYVAEVKGVLLSRAPGVTLVDVTHHVPPGDVPAARYLLDRAWPRFPTRTVHLAVVDPGVGTARRAVALEAHGHFFVGPDNGLFTSLLPTARAVVLEDPPEAAPTFHGRDVFAPAAARLAGGAPLASLGATARDLVALPPGPPAGQDGALHGAVIHVDHFGTLVTDLPAARVPKGARVTVAGHDVGSLRRTFGDVAPGAPLAFPGSGGTVEIAVRDGSAARTLGVGRGAAVTVAVP